MKIEAIDKKHVAFAIRIAGAVMTWALLVQLARFCMGKVGAPGLDQLILRLNEQFPISVDPQSLSALVGGWLMKVAHYMSGIAYWLFAASLVSECSDAGARIVMVGYKQFREEEKAAYKEARRLERIEAARERRRELQCKKNEPKGGFGVISFITGVILGSILFK